MKEYFQWFDRTRWIVCAVLAGGIAGAQAQTGDEIATPSNSAQTPALPPSPKTPVDYFRELLAMRPTARQERLAEKPASHREFLLVKLEEYEALDRKERERRLRQVELRWHLKPLLEAPSQKRRQKFERVPKEYRGLIETRLQRWDQLPAELQAEVSANDWMVDYIIRLDAGPPSAGQATAKELYRDYRQQIDEELRQWNALPVRQRTRMYEDFREFFELPLDEKERTLKVLPTSDRIELQQTLSQFENLTPAQRAACIESFRKFSSLSRPEQEMFLQNAARWQRMSERERSAWRSLVRRLPPTPPGLESQTPDLPGEPSDRPELPTPPLPGGQD